MGFGKGEGGGAEAVWREQGGRQQLWLHSLFGQPLAPHLAIIYSSKTAPPSPVLNVEGDLVLKLSK